MNGSPDSERFDIRCHVFVGDVSFVYVFQVGSCSLIYRFLELAVDDYITICDVVTLEPISFRNHACYSAARTI